MFSLLIIQGCGGGGGSGSGSSTAESSGQALIGLTDAPGDFVNYQVKVTKLTLYKHNGVVVEALPLTTSVDFAQLTDMTEFLTAGTIPSGTYDKIVMTLDYSGAEIAVENSLGESVAVPIANIQDETGIRITQPVDITVQLDDTSYLVVAPGIPAHLALDFNLAATNTVTFALDGTPTLRVSPDLKADVQPDSDKIQRFRGPLQDVDISSNTFDIILRPFAHDLRVHDRDFGTIKVYVNGSTVYNIDGTGYQGSAGLAALKNEAAYTGVIAHGHFDSQFHFIAEEVLAGTSVPGGTMDVARGTVLSRSGDVLTLKGATALRADGTIGYNQIIHATLGANTKVSKQFSRDDFSKDDISVGQRILVFGTLGGNNLDATNGFARMYLTTLIGHTVVPVSPETMAMNLQLVDWRKISLFDFTGTGIDGTHDADPTHYVINPGALTIPSTGDSVRVKGFVSPFGQVGSGSVTADFTARTIIDVTNAVGMMNVGWGSGSTTAISAISATQGLTLNLTDAGFFHRVNLGGVITDLKDDLGLTSIVVAPSNSPFARFCIDQTGGAHVYISFKSFIDALQTSDKVKHIHAWGTFDDATGTMTAKYILVKLG
jgi:hypothetical protein